MSNEQINIRICINFSGDRNSNVATKFFRYDKNDETVKIKDSELRQLLLANGSNVNVEVSFGDGHETRDAVGLMDTLGETRLTLYARREKSIDEKAVDWNDLDIVLYRDKEATEKVARYPWPYYKSKPRYGDSLVVHNCATYYLIWLTDLEPQKV